MIKEKLMLLIAVMGTLFIASCSSDNECDNVCSADQVQLLDCRCVTDASTIIPDPCQGTAACAAGQIKEYPSCNCVDVATPLCDGKTCPDGELLNTVTCNCEMIPDVVGAVTVTGAITENTTWTANNIYTISGKVPVENGAVLTIDPGTIIKGATGTDVNASALVVARGSQIMAAGTSDQPIIFTSVLDEIQPGQILSPNLTQFNNGLWGGLIILGNAPISAGDGDTEAQIEGIVADDLFGRYGGSDPTDNSGVLQYVSVRHGGAEIGAGNEINGITFGGVGSGTVVENIEVVANADDGIEWFGGTVNVTNAVVSDCDDDGLDIDQNYAGTISNAFVIQSKATGGDNAIEIDGPEGTATDGFFTINGMTLIDEDGESDTGGDLKSKTQGTIMNASWRGFSDNVKIRSSCEEDCTTTKSDSYQNYIDGKLSIVGSEWVGTAAITDWTTVYGDRDCPDADADGEKEICDITDAQQTAISDLLSANDNIISGSATRGADTAPFASWSWVVANSKI